MTADAYLTTFCSSRMRLLDPAFGIRDCEWERGVVEAIRLGKAAPGGVSVYDVVKPRYLADGPRNGPGEWGLGGWERAEKWARNANRIGAVFLNDEAIALRLPDRQRRKKAYAEFLAEERVRKEREAIKRAEEEAARQEAERAYRKREAERIRRERAQFEEWEKIQAERVALAHKRDQERAQAKQAEAERKMREVDAEAIAALAVRRRQQERAEILRSTWSCMKCMTTIKPELHLGKYLFACSGCGHRVEVEHERIMAAMRTGA